MSWPRAFVAWLVLALAMVMNGVAREVLLTGALEPLAAHQVSSVSGIATIFLVSWFLVPWTGASSPKHQLSLGIVWLFCTVVFEFSFGHWGAGHSWQVLLADYDLTSGRLWVLVLLATCSAPSLVGRLRDGRDG